MFHCRVALGGVGRPSNQTLEMRVDRRIALAAGVLQSFDIEDLNATAPIPDQARILQFASHQGDAAALHAQHLGQKFLGEWQRIAADQIAGLQ